jgi:hypothetical protein
MKLHKALHLKKSEAKQDLISKSTQSYKPSDKSIITYTKHINPIQFNIIIYVFYSKIFIITKKLISIKNKNKNKKASKFN